MDDFYFIVSERYFHSTRSHDSMNHYTWAESNVTDASFTYSISFQQVSAS